MEGMFFGPKQSLYGAYHPPTSNAEGLESAVLICQSMGHEYMRAHRAMWQLAERATRRNAHVFRFDYYGTGDSRGRVNAPDWDEWLADVRHALHALQQQSGLMQVAVLGVRVGALVAAEASRMLPTVRRLVLFDPVVDGASYLNELLDTHIAYQRERNRYRPRKHELPEADTDEYVGFHVPEQFASALGRRSLAPVLRGHPARCTLVTSTDPAPGDPVRKLAQLISDELVVSGDPTAWADAAMANRRMALPASTPALLDALLAPAVEGGGHG